MSSKKDFIKKLLSLVISCALCVGVFPFAVANVACATPQSYARIADPSTMDGWKTVFSSENLTTEYAGGIWTDKSVFVSDDDFGGLVKMENDKENFLVALSAIASDQSVTGYSQIPTDTVFVLDVSRSMGENVQDGDRNNNAVAELVAATNNAMAKLLAANKNNRVGIVLYSGTYSSDVYADASNALVLLPLGRYEQENNIFLEKDNHIFRVGETLRTAESIKVNASVTSEGVTVEEKEREIFGGTFIQGGVYAALGEFLNVEDTEIIGGDFQSGTKRLPVMVLMADGVATSAATNYMGENGTIGTSDMGNGLTPEDELGTAIPFATQLTCSYAKEKMKEHYGREPLFYTLGYNVKSTPVLDPENTTTDLHWQTYNITEKGGVMQLAIKSTWIASGWWGEGHWDEEYTTIRKSDYDLNKNYVDRYFYTDDDLVGTFGDIIDRIISESLYYPTQVTSGNIHHDGYVEFIDDIGQFMQVKKVHGILLGDVLFTGENVASNFIAGGGKLGTIDKPSSLGDELIRSVKARLGIAETKKAQELVRAAYISKQLYSDASTGEWSNYIGWYADADGKFLGHGTRELENCPDNAVFYNESYGFLGEVTDGHKNSDMMYVSVQVHTRIATGTSAVIFRIPASLLPVLSYNVTLTGESLKDPGDITLTMNDIIKKDTDNDGDFDEVVQVAPMRLVFEVGLKDEINELNVSEITGEDYKYQKDGNYDFYVSRWNPDDIDHENPSVAENTVSFFTPSSDNGRYYYAENATVYRKTGDEYVAYMGEVSPADANEVFYREYAVFEKMNNNEKGNARLHLHYEEMSEDALSVAEIGADATWYVPKGTVYRMYRGHHVGKGGFTDETQTQVNSNLTGTVMYSHYLGVELTKTESGEATYYADVVHGNNGKLSLKQAQGIKLSVETDITLLGRDDVFSFELIDENLSVSETLRLAKVTAQGELTESSVQFTDGKLEIHLASGESAYVLDIPSSSPIKIKELMGDTDYQVKSVNSEEQEEVTLSVKDNEIAEVRFVNTLEYPKNSANIIIYNRITHPFGEEYKIPDTVKFIYEIKTTDAEGNVHTESVTLQPFETNRISGIPLGTTVEITEQRAKGFVSQKETDTTTIIVGDELNYVAEFVNTYSPEAVSPKATVKGVKNFYGRENGLWLEGDEFTFKLQKQTDGVWSELAEATVTKDNKGFDFSSVLQAEVYKKAGVYSYRITEVFDENSYKGITYDKSVRWFDVFVEDKDMDGSFEIDKFVPYMGTTADFDEEADVWNINTTFTNTYAVTGSDAVTVVVKNKVVNSETMEEDNTFSKAGFEFGLYQGDRLITILPATSEDGETMVTLAYGTLDMGKHIHYQLKPVSLENPDENINYTNQVYNIAVEVQDDTQGGVNTVLTVTEDKEGAESVIADEVEVEFLNYTKTQSKPPADISPDSEPEIPTEPNFPAVPDAEKDPESSVGESDNSEKPDIPQTGFAKIMDNLLWILFLVLIVVSGFGVIFTSRKRK